MYCIQVGKSLLAPVLLSTVFSVRAVILLLCNQLWGKKIPRDHRSKTGPGACLAGALVWSSSLGRVTPLTSASPLPPSEVCPVTDEPNDSRTKQPAIEHSLVICQRPWWRFSEENTQGHPLFHTHPHIKSFQKYHENQGKNRLLELVKCFR